MSKSKMTNCAAVTGKTKQLSGTSKFIPERSSSTLKGSQNQLDKAGHVPLTKRGQGWKPAEMKPVLEREHLSLSDSDIDFDEGAPRQDEYLEWSEDGDDGRDDSYFDEPFLNEQETYDLEFEESLPSFFDRPDRRCSDKEPLDGHDWDSLDKE